MDHHTDWTLPIFLATIIFLLYMRRVFPRKYEALSACLWSYNMLYQFYQPSKKFPFDSFILLRNLSFYALLPLALVLAYRFSKGQELLFNDWRPYFGIMIFFFIFQNLQRWLGGFLGWVFKQNGNVTEQFFLKGFIWHSLIIWMLPLMIILVFTFNESIYISKFIIYLLISSYIWSIFQSLRAFHKKSGMPTAYVFYYLCALEILPWIVVLNHSGEWMKSIGF